MSLFLKPVTSADSAISSMHRADTRWIELCAFSVILLVLNAHLLPKDVADSLVFDPYAVLQGHQWWRVTSYPFVHVSWYHLLLDGMAFLGLYQSLDEQHALFRLGHVVASIAGSLIAPLLCTSLIYTHGLCGLSGPAHGLMAVLALELTTKERGDNVLRRAGVMCLLGLTAKCIVELITNRPVFGTLHFGLIGTPIVSCHAGGMLGSVISFVFLSIWKRNNRKLADQSQTHSVNSLLPKYSDH